MLKHLTVACVILGAVAISPGIHAEILRRSSLWMTSCQKTERRRSVRLRRRS